MDDIRLHGVHIDEENDRVLAIAQSCVALMPYHTPGGAVDWEHCTLRRWLNGSFYRALPLTVRSRVLEVENRNAANAKHGTHGGNPTVDRVFLLSIDEVERYFPTPTRTDGEAGISELKRLHAFWRAGFQDRLLGWWWLRSPGKDSRFAATVSSTGEPGVCHEGHDVYGQMESPKEEPGLLGSPFGKPFACGVRPAMWLEL